MEKSYQEPYSQSIFWVDVEKISPNPYQPRKDFEPRALESLSQSIKQYGVLQPIVVTRVEFEKGDGGIGVRYELVAGERRLRAAKMAGLLQIPALIRGREDDDKIKLEIAIIENLQREDLNPVDKAKAFAQLTKDFGLTHGEVAQKVGKSREYVSNSIRVLMLPEEILRAVSEGHISEGHTRPILMLHGRNEEQYALFQQIVKDRLTVREAEAQSRRVAQDKVRRPERIFDRDTFALEEELAAKLGTRVRIERKEDGGKIMIEFFSPDDLDNILNIIEEGRSAQSDAPENVLSEEELLETSDETRSESDDDLYSVKNFSI